MEKLETQIIMAESVLGRKLFPLETRAQLLTIYEEKSDDPHLIEHLQEHFGERYGLFLETIGLLSEMQQTEDIMSVARKIKALEHLKETAKSLDYGAPAFQAPDDYLSVTEIAAQLNITEGTILENLKAAGLKPHRFASNYDPRILSLYLSPDETQKIKRTLNRPPPGWQSAYHIRSLNYQGAGEQKINAILDTLSRKMPHRIKRYTKKNTLHCDEALATELVDCKTKSDFQKLVEKYT